ncbi:MAG: bifunctional aspartate kinase/homoserine dehydrogenase I [Flavobacteriales bacterium]
MYVLKFGGSSVSSPETIKQVKSIVESRYENEKLLLIVSAFSGITDHIIKTGKLAASGSVEYKTETQAIRDRHIHAVMDLIGEDGETMTQVKEMLNDFEQMCYGAYLVKDLSDRTLDFLLSTGELLSSIIIAAYLNKSGIDTLWVDSRKYISTDERFSCAGVLLKESYKEIGKLKKETRVMIAPGFIGSTSNGETTTLGRGGSDYSGALYAYGLDAVQFEKWTDVSGMLTSDPRIVDSAKVIKQLSYEEAMELSHFGAKVIYPPSIRPVLEKRIPIVVKNTFKPEDTGTYINGVVEHETSAVRGLSSIGGISLLTLTGAGMVGVPGFSGRLFSALARAEVNVILITQSSSEHSISVSISTVDIATAVAAVNEEFEIDIYKKRVEPAHIEQDLSIIAIVGDNMKHKAGIGGKTLYSLGKNGINIRAIAQGSSERNISIVVSDSDVKKALNTLHEGFFEAEIKTINLFLVGVGNVGGTLIDQIKKQREQLMKEHLIDLQVTGMTNSRKMLISEEGLDLEDWEVSLIKEGKPASMKGFIEQIKALNTRNAVFVDNTAHESVSQHYAELLSSSIAVVCSNKIAASSDYESYLDLKKKALAHNTAFMFETNVGAGLPIIDTIQNLVKSGDKVHEIEAILSGSLTFIFNNFDEKTTFKAVVKQAMNEGYTEPDPRIDLSGKDVARKILILAREGGYKMEMDEISADAFLPKNIMENGSVDDFVKALEGEEEALQRLYKSAKDKGAKLKFVAQFKNGKAKTGLIEVTAEHPFFNIEGKDNIVLIKTERYGDQPLVVKGAGAGAEVTAMGVFADIIRLAKN